MPEVIAAPVRAVASRRRSRLARGALVLLAAMTLGVSGAAAQTLKKGARGKAVTALQQKLGLPADGVFGPQTHRAVKRFQRRKGLTVDGIAGPATLGALGLTVKPRTTKTSSTASILARIAQCESGGNPRAISPGGQYRGKYQFSRPTWRSLGGKGDPAKAPEAEQDRLARLLYERAGTSPWPHCGAGL